MTPYLLHHFLEAHADRTPEAVLSFHDGHVMNYGDADQLANKFGAALHALGVRRGDRVGLLVENSGDYIAAYYGILKAGAAAVSIFTTTTTKTLSFILHDCGVKVLITQSKFISLLEGLPEKLPELQGMILTDDSAAPVAWPARVMHKRELDELPGRRLHVPMIDIDLAAIIYTSGSTGDPRGAMLSHLNIMSNTRSIVSYLGLTAKDRIMVVLPFPYVYGKSLLNTHVAAGGSVLIDNRFVFPNIVLKTMQEHHATGFAGVPSTFAILLGKSTIRKMEFPALRYLTQAGGAMAPSLIREVMEVFDGKKIFIMYGATEASARLSYLSPDDLPRKVGSIGKAIPNVELRLIKENGEEAGADEAGEIVARGSNIMSGYWNQPEETRQALTQHGFHTGDLGRKDEEGFFYVVGRKRDMIKSGANRVSAKEIEEVILEHAKILETAVIGVPDQYLGEAICAYVSLKPEAVNGKDEELAEEIIAFCRERLPEFKVPRQVIVEEKLPKNESGKIMKQVLRERVGKRE